MPEFKKQPYTKPEVKKVEKPFSKESKVKVPHKFQERPTFFDEIVMDQDKGDARRKPSPEEREAMDGNIIKLGKLFEGSDIKWQLDGALNISLMKGEYIGLHKDIDLSVDPKDAEQLEDDLLKKGYGLFLTYAKEDDPDGKRIMERVDAQSFAAAQPEEHLMLAAIDEQGKIKEDEKFNYIDVHLIKRNEKGEPLSANGVPLPKEWYEPQKTKYQGQEINLSHPAKVAYFKLQGKRPFDHTDNIDLVETGKLTLKDINEISTIIEQEIKLRQERAKNILIKIVAKIKGNMTAKQILEVFKNEPAIAKQVQKMESTLTELSNKIAKSKDKSLEKILQLTLDTFQINQSFAEQENKIDELRSRAKEINEMKNIRKKI